MMTDQFECAFVTGFRQDQENLSYLMLSIIIEKKKILKQIVFVKPYGIHIQA